MKRSLDPELVGEVLEVRQQLAEKGMTMVVVTHETQFAREVANRVMFLDRGYVVAEGPAREVLTNPQSERFGLFLSQMRQGQINQPQSTPASRSMQA